MQVQESHKAIAIGLAALFLMQAPFVAGLLLAPKGTRFLGLTRVWNDQAQYFAWIQEARSALLLSNLCDPDARAHVFFHPLFQAIGGFGVLLGGRPMAAYQAARVAFEVAGLVLLWRLVCRCLPAARLFAFTMASLGGGIAPYLWLLHRAGGPAIGSADVDVPENSFFSAASLPHFGCALTLQIAIVLALLGARDLGCLASLMLLGFVHVFDVVTMTLAIVATLVLDRQWRRLWIAAGAVPPALYYAWLTFFASGYRDYGAQNVTLSPHPMRYVLGLLAPLSLAITGVVLNRPLGREMRCVAAWAVVSAALLYAPIQVQRRFHLGLSIPLCLLAAWGLPKLPARRLVAAGALALALPSPLFWIAGDVAAMERSRRPYVLATGEIEAMRWLSRHASSDDVVLAMPVSSMQAMVVAGFRAYYLHPVVTSRARERRGAAVEFFRSGGASALPEGRAVRLLGIRREHRRVDAWSARDSRGRAPVYRAGVVAIWDLGSVRPPREMRRPPDHAPPRSRRGGGALGPRCHRAARLLDHGMGRAKAPHGSA
ncbi:MAG: hypothetical protein U0166_13260 [Acidobacteriota bacterium]